MRLAAITCLCVFLSFVTNVRVGLAGNDEKKDKGGIAFDKTSADIRDLLLLCAARARKSLIISPGISGTLSLTVTGRSPEDLLRILPAAAGCSTRNFGDIIVVIRENERTRPKPPGMDLDRSKRCKAMVMDRASLRTALLNLAAVLNLPVIVGQKVDGTCPVHLIDVPAADAIEALVWTGNLSWAKLDGVLFIGTARSVRAAKDSLPPSDSGQH